MDNQETPSFGPIRKILWPIHSNELPKILCFLAISFFLIGPSFLLRDLRDKLLIIHNLSSTTFLPLSLLGIVLAFLFTFKLTNWVSRKKLFYVIIIPLLAFITFFSYSSLPKICSSTEPTFVYWQLFSLVFCNDLWTGVVFSCLFWIFVNDVTTTPDAKRWYPLLYVYFGVCFAGIVYSAAPKQMTELESMQYVLQAVLLGGVVALAFYWILNKFILRNTQLSEERNNPLPTPAVQSFLSLVQSKYIWTLTLLFISSFVAQLLSNLMISFEKSAVLSELNKYQELITIIRVPMAALLLLVGCLWIGNNALRKSWTFAATIPVVCITLFWLPLFLTGSFAIFSPTLYMFGTIGIVVMGTATFCMFYPAFNIAFLSLEPETRMKSQLLIGLLTTLLFMVEPYFFNLLSITPQNSSILIPIMGLVFVGSIFVWYRSVKTLGRLSEARQIA